MVETWRFHINIWIYQYSIPAWQYWLRLSSGLRPFRQHILQFDKVLSFPPVSSSSQPALPMGNTQLLPGIYLPWRLHEERGTGGRCRKPVPFSSSTTREAKAFSCTLQNLISHLPFSSAQDLYLDFVFTPDNSTRISCNIFSILSYQVSSSYY